MSKKGLYCVALSWGIVFGDTGIRIICLLSILYIIYGGTEWK